MDDFWTIFGSVASGLAVIIAILVWRSSKRDNSPNKKDVEELATLFQSAAYSADVLEKGTSTDETEHVERFKKCAFKMHEISTALIERNSSNRAIIKATTSFYEAFQQKRSLDICRARLDVLQKLVG